MWAPNLSDAEYSIADHRWDDLQLGARWTARGIVNMQRRAASIPLPRVADESPEPSPTVPVAVEDYAVAAPYVIVPVTVTIRVPLDRFGQVVKDDYRKIVSFEYRQVMYYR